MVVTGKTDAFAHISRCSDSANALPELYFLPGKGEGKVAMIHSRAWGHSHDACVYLSERSAMAQAYVNMDIRLFLAELLT
jgi:hypothetical protein